MQYYYSIDGAQQQGPIDRDQLLAAGVTAATTVWRDGLPGWTAARDLPELADLFAPAPAAYQAQPQTYEASPVQYQSQPYVQQPASNGMAVASLVLGIIGVVSICMYGLGAIAGVLAIVFGHMARSQIRRGHGTGDGLAMAGLVMGYIAVGLVVLIIGVALVVILFAGTAAATAGPKFTPVTPLAPPTTPGGHLLQLLFGLVF